MSNQNTPVMQYFLDNHNKLRAYANKYYSRAMNPDDLMQNVAITLIRYKGNVDNIPAFIKVAIKNEAINAVRTKVKDADKKNYQEIKDEHVITNKTPEWELNRKQLCEAIHNKMNSNSKLSKIMKLKLLAGLNNEEIGIELRLTKEQVRSNVKVNLFNGKLNHLKELL